MNSANGVLLVLMALVVVGLAAWLLTAARAVAAGPAATVVVRCLAGHVFTTTWNPTRRWRASLFGTLRWQYCPAGEHWTLVTLVRPEDLTAAEWRMARRCHDDSVR